MALKCWNKPSPGWAVVVRRHRQAANNTAVVETLRQTNGFRGRIGAGSGNNRNTPVSQLQRHHHHIAMFIMTQGGGLTGGANRNDRRGAAGDMIINQFFRLDRQTLPFSSIGVTSATILPVNMGHPLCKQVSQWYVWYDNKSKRPEPF